MRCKKYKLPNEYKLVSNSKSSNSFFGKSGNSAFSGQSEIAGILED
jgi:hypothetical protein